MSVRYQHGYLRCKKRKNGSACWEFMWREQESSGKRVHRTAVIGTAEQYPTEELAQEAVRGLRMQINEARNRQPNQSIHVSDLIGHYLSTELAADWHSHATRIVYREFLTRWIKPYWGLVNIRDVRTVAFENWLRQLRRQDGDDLANSTKAKIRSVMSVIFNHAIRNEWLEQGRNPITFVRQSALRKSTPAVLEPQEIQALLSALEQPFRLMVLLDVTTGLRRSELFALKWSDIDFWNLVVDIRRSICEGVVGTCKTEASRRPIPLSLEVAADLWLLKESTNYATPDDLGVREPTRQREKFAKAGRSALEQFRSMTPEIAEILTNKEVIAVDQDALGMQGRRVKREGEEDVIRNACITLAVADLLSELFREIESRTYISAV